MARVRRGILLALLVVTGCCCTGRATAAAAAAEPAQQQRASKQPAPFLAEQLPLKVLVSTPSELATGLDADAAGALTLSGRQAITAVFSRPVLALGADWGMQQLRREQTPFALSCGVPGRLRWVTTNIARFDPAVDWPPDLNCTFAWNRGLRAYDGAALQLGAGVPPATRLQTQPLQMSVDRVDSAAAVAATGGQWSAFIGGPGDQLPEVPPDGNLTLTFSYPVQLDLLAKALRLAGPDAGNRTLAVAPCWSPAAPAGPPSSTNKAPNSSSSKADALRQNSTCVVVRIVPGLAPGAAAVLRLPRGARYSSLAGSVAKDTDVDVYGLRPFRIPLRWDFTNISTMQDTIFSGASYRRLSMWLPHGLAKDTSLPALKATMRLCSLVDPLAPLASAADLDRAACADQDFQISRPAPGLLLMRVPGLQPRQRYVLRFKGDAKVKDAFGLPLQPSADVWWAVHLESAFAGPAVQRVALLEPAAQPQQQLSWPWVSRGFNRDPQARDPLQQVQAWSVPVGPASSSSKSAPGGSMQLEQALASITVGWGGTGAVVGTLSAAGATLSRTSAYWPTFHNLSLPGQPGVSYLGACCNTISWPQPHQALANGALVVQSGLQAAFVEQGGQLLAWVTSSQGESAPVRGALVRVFLAKLSYLETAVAGPSCTTDADGTCSLDLAAYAARVAQQQQQQQKQQAGAKQSSFVFPGSYVSSAVITADGHGPLVVPGLPYGGRLHGSSSRSSSGPEYVATIVLDRLLVKPGDDLHVTAYIQQREGSELRAPTNLSQVVLQVAPSFAPPGTPAAQRTPTRIVASVDPVFGSVHVVIPVPKDATPAHYALQLATPAPALGSGSNAASNAANNAAVIALQPSAAGSALPLDVAAAPVREPPLVAAAPADESDEAATDAPAAGNAQPAAGNALVAVPAVVDSNVASSSDGPSSQRRLQQRSSSTSRPATTAAAPQPGATVTPPTASSSVPMASLPVARQQPPRVGAVLSSASFTVADPRPPTASLQLNSSSPWVKPDGSLDASVAARSYVGSDVAGAEVAVQWSTAKAAGELRLTTDARGAARGRIDLGRLPVANRSEPGDVLTLRASWVGPTRELLTQSATVKIADGPLRVELSRTLMTDVPGVAFGVHADAFKNEDDSPVKGTTVDVTLVPRNGSASLAGCSEAARASLAQQRCSIKAGDAASVASCQLRLPCAGDFLLRGCVAGGGGCSRPLRIGRNASSWAAAPWSSGPGQLRLLADRQNVSEGANLTLFTQNPLFGPASALLVWGDGELREQRVLPEIPPGLVTIKMVDLGPECRAGCRVVLMLAAARPAATGPNSNAAGNSSSSSPAAGGSSSRQRQALALEQAPAVIEVRGRQGGIWPLNQRGGSSSSSGTATHSAPGGWGSWLGSWRGGSTERGATGTSAAAQGTGSSSGSSSRRAANPLPDVPRSRLYDPLAPVTASAELQLGGVSDEGLRVALAVAGQSKDALSGAAVVAPKSTLGSIDVAVKDAAGKPVAGAEVTLVVVDRAILDQMPYGLQNVSVAMEPPLSAVFNVQHLNALRVGRAAINATFATLQRRLLSIDPYLPVDTQVTPALDTWRASDYDGANLWLPPPPVAAVDVPDDRYLAGLTTPLTPLPARVCAWGDASCPLGGGGGGFGAVPVMADAAVGLAAPVAALAKPAMAVARSKSVMAAEGPASNAAALGAAAAPAPSPAPLPAPGGGLRVQQDFKVTALFTTVRTGSDGTVSVPLPAPDNLGRFSVRAYVAAPQPARSTRTSGTTTSASAVQYGQAESEVLVRRTVSLLPALPRQVRTGDSFSAGVLVEAPGATTGVTVVVTAALQHAGDSSKVMRMSGPRSASVLLTPSKPQTEVRFAFHADSIGTQNLTFAASVEADGGSANSTGPPGRLLRRLQQLLAPPGSSGPGQQQPSSAGAVADQVQLQLPVLGKQGPVWVATSFALRGSSSTNKSGSWQEGLVLPRAERGSGSLDLVAGVGSLPAIQTAYAGLAEQGLDGVFGCASGSQAVALSVLPALLALYRPPDTPVSALLNSSALQLTAAAASAAAGKLTSARFGLLPQDPGCVSAFAGSGSSPQRADIPLNAWAAWLVQQSVGSSGSRTPPGSPGPATAAAAPGASLATAWDWLGGAAKTWSSALQAQLVADAAAARRGAPGQPPAPYADLEALSWARLVLGPGWSPAAAKSLQPAAPDAPNNGGGDGGAAAAAALADAVRGDLSMQRLTAAALAGNLTVGGQARVGLALLQDPKARSAGSSDSSSSGNKTKKAADAATSPAVAVRKLAQRMSGSMRVGGRTAYVAAGEGKRAAAGLSDQALALAFLTEAGDGSSGSAGSGADNPLVQKLAAWVAQGASPPPLAFAAIAPSSSAWEAALRAQALTSYDASTSSTAPDVQLEVAAVPRASSSKNKAPKGSSSSNGSSDNPASAVQLLSAAFTPANAGRVVVSSTPWRALPANASLALSAHGAGEVSVAASLNFTPAELLPFPTYRGLWVQSALLVGGAEDGRGPGAAAPSRARNSSSTGSVEAGVGLGQLVTVAVQVTSPDDQADVVVEVLLPGGLEVLDPNVARDPDAATLCGSSSDEDSSGNSGGGIMPMLPGGPVVKMVAGAAGPAPRGIAGGMSAWAPPSLLSLGSRARLVWPMCPTQITAPDSVSFRYSFLRAGTHSVRFRALAATPGTWVLPPVKAFVAGQPEVMGLSGAGSLTVCAKAAGGCVQQAPKKQQQPVAAAAKGCPADCNGSNGACNLATGVCICATGFSGPACGGFA